jgi:3-oxoacyl-[acyl-carrier-protein] synthase-3
VSLTRVFLSAPRYVLGEIELDHSEIGNLPERAEEFGMPRRPELWGWGKVHRTEKSLETLAIECGTATLRGAALDPVSVDALVLCSTRFPGDAETHGNFVETIVTGLGTGNHDVMGMTLNRCTNLLAGLRVAQALIAGGSHRRVLVITTDRVADETTRMRNFALFSDGAAACLVTDTDGEYELVASGAAHDTTAMDWSHEISADLSRRVNEALLTSRDMKLDDVDGLMHSNIYKPVVMMKELQAGFSASQLCTGNIERFGHCFAADPVVNLADRDAADRIRDGRHYMLAASVPGVRVGILLRKLPVATGR